MEGCLLCIDLNKKLEQHININSEEWQELNIQYLIEKHLWSMNHYDSFNWICSSCCKELQAFHKFYCRIEETHINFGFLAKGVIIETKDEFLNEISTNENDIIDNDNFNDTEDETEVENIDNIEINQINDYNETSNEEFKNIFNNLETEINVEDEIKSVVKDYLNEQSVVDDSGEHCIDIPPKRKRGRPRKEINIEDEIKSVVKDNLNVQNVEDDSEEHCIEITPKRKRGRPSKNDSKNTESYTNTAKKSVKQRKCKEVAIISNDNRKETESLAENILDDNNGTEIKQCLEEESQILLDNYKQSRDSDVSDFEPDKSKSLTNSTKNKNYDDMDKFLAEHFKITCYICNIPMETFSVMRKHFDVHHNGRGHVKCCNKKIFRRNILADHIHRHLDPNYFKCQKCDKVLADRRCLELHMEIHEGNQEKIHGCDICGKSFAKISVLKIHRTIHLSEEEKRFPCTVCGKKFASKYLLSCHNRYIHLKTYAKVCDICGKTIYCKDLFERHMLQHEGRKAPTVTCDVCGLILTDEKALKRHKSIVHPEGGQKEYACTMCSKISPNLMAHKRHVKFKHEMGYDHICTICNKAFKRAQTLKEHMASHTGTVLYTCPWCPKTFNSNANMHHHRKKMHPKEWEETSRKRYSGNLPPNFKPPTVPASTNFNLPMDI